VVPAPAPERLIKGGLPTEAVVAFVLVAKYAGKVADMLPDAELIDQAFDLQPAFLGILPNKCLYLDSELQFDTDGWPDGRGKGDKYWQPTTSLRYADNTSLNANKIPYFVLPLPKSWKPSEPSGAVQSQ
jgi:hypothetical protein